MGEEKSVQHNGGGGDICPTGIEGLDDVLAGGLPRNSLYLVQGEPGSGKTTLALQFLLEGMRRGEAVYYITLSETRWELQKTARSHGWSLEKMPMLELSDLEVLTRPEAQTIFHSSELELNQLSQRLLEEVRKLQPRRIVFDSLSEFRLMAESPLRYRRHILSLKQEYAKYKSTVLLLDDNTDETRIGSDPHVQSIAHGAIELAQDTPDYGITRRRMRVRKLRGVKFREGFHDFSIVKGGLRVFPRLVAAEHHARFDHKPRPSGIKELDDLLGGGLDYGTTTLILGQAGTGKTSIALHYAVQMARQGELSALFTFDETLNVLRARAEELGLNMEKLFAKGQIIVQQVDPAELSPGEFANRIIGLVRSGCKMVVIDSLNGYLNSMPGEKYLNNQLHELSSYLNQQGVVTVFILAQHGLLAAAEAPVDISYLADTVVNLRFFEAAGSVKQAIAVIKKRSGRHERTIREFRLETGGIRVGPPLQEFQGILSGTPVFHGDAHQILSPTDAVH
ncbi:MAG TPA: ATPase domain-containing protein [Verrucomicrobiae bacterium]|nr:ATPase domain-containing protein [Verrucomicrobiae bacterium]